MNLLRESLNSIAFPSIEARSKVGINAYCVYREQATQAMQVW
jgi:hypothetical protein